MRHGRAALVEIGREVSEQLEIIPAQIQVLRHIRIKYGCPHCHEGVKTAPLPPQPIPKSQASPGLLAYVGTAKYVDGLPLYRQTTILQRCGMTLSRSTLAHYMVKTGQLVQPLVNLLRDRALDSGYLLMDETVVQVLKEKNRSAASPSYMWVQRTGSAEAPIILFEYDPSRSGEVPKRLLEGFKGYLQTDGYGGYDEVNAWPGVTGVGCWAHARRKFDEAIKAAGTVKSHAGGAPPGGKARQGVGFIQQLYQVERRAREKQ